METVCTRDGWVREEGILGKRGGRGAWSMRVPMAGLMNPYENRAIPTNLICQRCEKEEERHAGIARLTTSKHIWTVSTNHTNQDVQAKAFNQVKGLIP
jgi:hypothetical protein